MTTDEGQFRTKLSGTPTRHATANSECLRFVRRCEHDAAPDRNGLATERRIEQLLNRSIECVEVRMKDGGSSFHPDRLSIKVRPPCANERQPYFVAGLRMR